MATKVTEDIFKKIISYNKKNTGSASVDFVNVYLGKQRGYARGIGFEVRLKILNELVKYPTVKTAEFLYSEALRKERFKYEPEEQMIAKNNISKTSLAALAPLVMGDIRKSNVKILLLAYDFLKASEQKEILHLLKQAPYEEVITFLREKLSVSVSNEYRFALYNTFKSIVYLAATNKDGEILLHAWNEAEDVSVDLTKFVIEHSSEGISSRSEILSKIKNFSIANFATKVRDGITRRQITMITTARNAAWSRISSVMSHS